MLVHSALKNLIMVHAIVKAPDYSFFLVSVQPERLPAPKAEEKKPQRQEGTKKKRQNDSSVLLCLGFLCVFESSWFILIPSW